VVLSPDGTRVAFVGVFRGLRQLYTRRLDQFETVAIRGTENANAVFMSPDGRALGFITADLALKTVSLADGLVTTIEHDAEFSAGAAWGADTFVRAGALCCPLLAVRRNSSRARPWKARFFHAWPASAQGRITLFASIRAAAAVRRTSRPSVASGERRVLVDRARFPLPSSGHLVFFRVAPYRRTI
jgi:hypothetical protein